MKRTRAAIICFDDEVAFSRHQLRKLGRRGEVLAQIRAFGGFTVFWATANLGRARMLETLEKEGAIACEPAGFPWTKARILGETEPKEL